MKLTFILLVLLFGVNAASVDFTSVCERIDGQLVNQITCPNSKEVRERSFCILKNNPLVFFNGCNVSVRGYGQTFLKACIEHDLCYHHEPSTSGYDRKKCDKLFYESMLAQCDKEGGSRRCKNMAWTYYRGVRAGGDKSYNCSNVKFDYKKVKL